MGVSKGGLANKWLARAHFAGGPSTFLGSWFETEEDAEAAVRQFENDGILPEQWHAASSSVLNSAVLGAWPLTPINRSLCDSNVNHLNMLKLRELKLKMHLT
jgi:hypothetical protein